MERKEASRGSGGKIRKPNGRSRPLTPYTRPVSQEQDVKWTVTGLLPILFSKAIAFFTRTLRSGNKLENLSNATMLTEFDHRLNQVKISNDNRLKEVESMGEKFTDDVKPREGNFDTNAGTEAAGTDLTQENFVTAEDELEDSNKFTGEALNTLPHQNCDVGTSNGSDSSSVYYSSKISGIMDNDSRGSDNCQNMTSNMVSGDGSHGRTKRSIKTPSYLKEYCLI